MKSVIFDNVSFSYDQHLIIENVNLEIETLDFIGILGPNGGGKTTLLKLLLGIIKPDSGEVIIKEGTKIGYVPQFTTFNRDFPIKVFDVILMGRLDDKVKAFHKYSKSDRTFVDNIITRLGIEPLKEKHISNLSGGQMQKVLIARALATEANLLVLDEPSASLDSESKNEIYHLLRDINSTTGILIVSHDIGVISSYVKNIACLNRSLHYHGGSEGAAGALEKAYGCPIDLIAHGHPHRVLKEHKEVVND